MRARPAMRPSPCGSSARPVTGCRWGRCSATSATIELSAGDLDAARRHLAESLDIARALNARSDIVYETFNLGLAEYLGGSPDAAEALFAESLDLARRTGMRANTAYALIGLALAGHGGADPGWSARLHGAADQALADLGHALEPLEARLADLDRQRLRAAMGAEAFEAEYAAGRTLDLARVLAALGREDAAAEQARVAHQALQGMQAGARRNPRVRWRANWTLPYRVRP